MRALRIFPLLCVFLAPRGRILFLIFPKGGLIKVI